MKETLRLALSALLIVFLGILYANVFISEDNVTMISDDKSIVLASKKDCTVKLTVTISNNNEETTITKEINLNQKQNKTLRVEDFTKDGGQISHVEWKINQKFGTEIEIVGIIVMVLFYLMVLFIWLPLMARQRYDRL